jgi:putative addiction module component (TIGR02574 family)
MTKSLTPLQILVIIQERQLFDIDLLELLLMDLLGPDTIVTEALKLPVPEPVEVLHRLWDSIPAESGSGFLDNGLLAELGARIAYEDAHPNDDFSWEEVKANVPRQPGAASCG